MLMRIARIVIGMRRNTYVLIYILEWPPGILGSEYGEYILGAK